MKRLSVLIASVSAAAVLLCVLEAVLLSGCGDAATPSVPAGGRAMGLRYAEQFTVDYDAAGRALVTINGTDRFLIIPEGTEAKPDTADGAEPGPGGGINSIEYSGDGAVVLRLPLPALYVASTSAMDFFRALDALDAVRFTGSKPSDWSLPEVREAMDTGQIVYAGKYSAPDLEALLSENCGLAVENTMILHSPDIREQLEALGIPVLVERSSYEAHPLGRMEWVKLYGLLTGREAEAAAFFDEQAAAVERIAAETGGGTDGNRETGGGTDGKTGGTASGETEKNAPRTAAFFSINSNGSVTVRRTGDYVTQMIELAGGRSVFTELLPEEDSARYAVNLQMEAFYAAARDADILIYNGTIDGGVDTLDQLASKSELLRDFRAFQSGEVWCTERNLFQEPTSAAGMIADLYAVFTGAAEGNLTYLRKLSPAL